MSESAAEALAALRVAIERFDQEAPLPTSPASKQITAEAAPDERRWAEIDRQLGAQIAGRRVLVVGPASGYDALAFAARGAEQVLACASPDPLGRTGPQTPLDEASIDFPKLAWDELSPERHGTFGIVHCTGLLHRALEPVALLRTLRGMTAEDGTLLIGSIMIDDPERSEYLRFVPDRYAGDPTWWFLPGRLAFRWLVQTAGFEVQAAFGEQEESGEGFPIVSGYLRATPR